MHEAVTASVDMMKGFISSWYPDIDYTSAINNEAELLVGDPLCDAVLSHLKPFAQQPKADLYKVIVELDPTSDECFDFLKSGFITDDWLRDRSAFLADIETVPDWVDWEKIRRGQVFFWDNYLTISQLILYGGLLPGNIGLNLRVSVQ